MIAIGDNSNLDSSVTITQAQGDCIRIRSSASSNTFKYGVIKLDPYNNNALGVQIVGAKSDSGYTEVDLGGGIEGGYAATQLYFWTAANTTTANGTLRWKIDSSGHFLPGTAGAVNIGSASAEIGDVYLADGKSVYLGSDQDVRIYYDSAGSSSFTIDANAGYTYINADALRLNSKTSAWNYLRGDKSDGVVKLYKSNSEKLATSDTGITVTGEVAATQDYPTTRPTLDLNFAATKKLDPRITYRRTGSASFTDEFGKVVKVGDNAPRFDHDPITRESKGLLIEESRTNVAESSEDFGNTSFWNPANQTITTNVATAPDGTLTADNVVPAAGSAATRYLYFSVSTFPMSANASYTSSIFVKKNGLRYFAFQVHDNGSGS